MNRILAAARFAAEAHAGQRRKFGVDAPYIIHPGRCSARSQRHLRGTDATACALWCHDVIEDCGKTAGELATIIGDDATAIVVELTNPSQVNADIKQLPRAERKLVDRMHIASASWQARFCKLIDRIDNMSDITPAAAKWLGTKYIYESEQLLKALIGTDPELELELLESIARAIALCERQHVEVLRRD